MFPVLFEIPIPGRDPFLVRSFGVMVAIGVLFGAHLLTRLANRHDPHPKPGDESELDAAARYGNITVWIILGVFIGARIMYVLVEMGRGTWQPETPFDVFAVWKGGLAMYGGFFGGSLAGIIGARKNGVSPLRGADLALSASFFGLALGRVGCFLVGDDYGSVVPEAYASLPFPITLTVPPLEWLKTNPESLFGLNNAGKTLWATQLWMCAGATTVGLLGLFWIKRRRYLGQVGLQLIVAYAIVRGTIEAFRGDEVRGVWFDGALSTSQGIAIVSGLIAAFFLFKFRGRSDPELTESPAS
jgi:phosphatidylglycerol:prolipoprotein diacylglycerol transferase